MGTKRTRTEVESSDEVIQKPRRSSGGLLTRNRLLMFAALVILLVFFAPTIAGKTPVRNWVVAKILTPIDGKLECSDANFGWFSNPQLINLKLTDSQGEIVCEAESVVVRKTLLQLLQSSADLGEIVVTKPRANLVVSEGTTNLQQVLQPWLDIPVENFQFPIVKVTIEEGKAQVVQPGRATIAVDQFSTTMAFDPEKFHAGGEIQFSAGATLEAAQAVTPAKVNFEASSELSDDPFQKGNLALQLASVDVGILNLLFDQVGLAAAVTGSANGEIKADWRLGDEWQVQADFTDLRATNLLATYPELLGQDRPAIGELVCKGKVGIGPQTLTFDNFETATAFASAKATGQLAWANLADLSKLFDRERKVEVAGKVDLAQVSRLLPNTLRIREDISVESGELTFDVRQEEEGGRSRIFANAEIAKIRARDRQTEFSFDQPIQFASAIREGSSGPELEFLSCRSSFLNAQGEGTLTKGKLTAEGNLNTLVDQLRRFANLPSAAELTGNLQGATGWDLAGTFRLDLNWSPDIELTNGLRNTSSDQTWMISDLQGNLFLDRFAFVVPNLASWREAKLEAKLGTKLGVHGTTVQTLETSWCNLVAGEDMLRVNIPGRLDLARTNEALTGSVAVAGDIQRWLARFNMATLPAGWTVAGKVDLTSEISGTLENIALRQASYKATDVRVTGPGTDASEAQAVGDFNATWYTPNQELFFETLTLRTSSLSLGAERLVLPTAKGLGFATGKVSFRTSLARLQNWFPYLLSSGNRIAGEAVGACDLGAEVKNPGPWRFGGKLTATIDNFEWHAAKKANALNPVAVATTIASNNQPTWVEKRIALESVAIYDLEKDFLQLNPLIVDGTTADVAVQGSIAKLTEACNTDLQGEWNLDPEKLNEMVRWAAKDFEIQGTTKQQFAMKGPLFTSGSGGVETVVVSTRPNTPRPLLPKAYQANTGFSWTGGKAYGINFGGTNIRASLNDNVVSMGEVAIPFDNGTIRLNPQIYLQADDTQIALAKGKVLEDVTFTPEMCKQWMMYVAPIVANSTNTKGKMSVTIDDSVLALSDPFASRISGTIEVQEATFGPGPQFRELVTTVQQVKSLFDGKPLNLDAINRDTWAALPNQSAKFEFRGRRIFHDQLRAQIGEVPIITSGSVGEDQSLDIVAYVPIMDEWVANRRELAGLKGKAISLPIRGTVSKPQIDSNALRQLTRDLATQAASGLLQNELQKGLDKGLGKLFGGDK